MSKPQIGELALFAIPSACLVLLAFAVAGLGFFLYGYFGGVAQITHFGKVLMAPFGLALCAVFLIEMCLWLCALAICALDKRKSDSSAIIGANTPHRAEDANQIAVEPEQDGGGNYLWPGTGPYIIVFSAVLALIGFVPLLLGVYRQERGLIVIGAWLVAPYSLIIAAWYLAIQIWQVTSRIDEIKTNKI